MRTLRLEGQLVQEALKKLVMTGLLLFFFNQLINFDLQINVILIISKSKYIQLIQRYNELNMNPSRGHFLDRGRLIIIVPLYKSIIERLKNEIRTIS